MRVWCTIELSHGACNRPEKIQPTIDQNKMVLNDTNDAGYSGDNNNTPENSDQDQVQNRSSLADIEASLEIAELHFPQVVDKSWLGCVPFPVGSVLGLAYEDEATGEEVLYSLQLRTLMLDGKNDPAKHHGVPPQTPSYPMKLVESAASPGTKSGAFKCYASKNQILWYDLRAYPRDTVWSSKQVLRLLRNLLGVSHSASPWSPTDHHDESACVVFLFESESLADKLMQFRVGDASPSWCLFGHAKLSSLPEFYQTRGESPPPSSSSATSTQDDAASGSNSYFMFVFRHLTRRARMSYRHPVSHELPSPVGCLWEAIKDKSSDSWSHRSVTPPYIDPSCEAFTHSLWTPWPEEAHYAAKPDGGAPWSVVPLLHCFPATDPSRRQWIPRFCELCPGTVEILKQCIGESSLRTALWSRLDPDSVLEAHTGMYIRITLLFSTAQCLLSSYVLASNRFKVGPTWPITCCGSIYRWLCPPVVSVALGSMAAWPSRRILSFSTIVRLIGRSTTRKRTSGSC
jgi:Aspartyl/Asparaginyl beta-hydroxylase